MEFAVVVYLISAISKLGLFLVIAAILSMIVLVVHCIDVGDSYQKSFKEDFKLRFLAAPVLLGLLITVIPSERTMYLMAGAYASQAVVQSEIGKDVIQVLELKIKEQLKELQPKGVNK